MSETPNNITYLGDTEPTNEDDNSSLPPVWTSLEFLDEDIQNFAKALAEQEDRMQQDVDVRPYFEILQESFDFDKTLPYDYEEDVTTEDTTTHSDQPDHGTLPQGALETVTQVADVGDVDMEGVEYSESGPSPTANVDDQYKAQSFLKGSKRTEKNEADMYREYLETVLKTDKTPFRENMRIEYNMWKIKKYGPTLKSAKKDETNRMAYMNKLEAENLAAGPSSAYSVPPVWIDLTGDEMDVDAEAGAGPENILSDGRPEPLQGTSAAPQEALFPAVPTGAGTGAYAFAGSSVESRSPITWEDLSMSASAAPATQPGHISAIGASAGAVGLAGPSMESRSPITWEDLGMSALSSPETQRGQIAAMAADIGGALPGPLLVGQGVAMPPAPQANVETNLPVALTDVKKSTGVTLKDVGLQPNHRLLDWMLRLLDHYEPIERERNRVKDFMNEKKLQNGHNFRCGQERDLRGRLKQAQQKVIKRVKAILLELDARGVTYDAILEELNQRVGAPIFHIINGYQGGVF